MNKRIIILFLTVPVLLALSCSKSPKYASRADRLIAELKNPKSADGGLDDDRAALSGDPDSIYGKLVDMGCSVIMTDRPAQVIQSLHRLGRHPALGVQ